jgi:hypothetical protein
VVVAVHSNWKCLMPKRKERHVRKVRQTLATPAAKPATERVLELSEKGLGTVPSSAAAAMAGYRPSGAPGTWGGATTPDATGQVGTPGNLNVFGFLTGEDYNSDLDGFAMFANYNKMRLSDAQVNATLLMLKLPLKGASWIIKPASDDAQDVAIADFVQANLIDDDALERSWQHVLDNAMLKFDFGCAASEIVWGLGDESHQDLSRVGRLIELAKQGAGEELELAESNGSTMYAKVRDLAPRLPRTFYRWVEDPKTQKLAFLQQFAPKNGQYGYWNISADRMVLHVRAREGNNYYGRSVLRTAYPHWWWKQQLYRIDMIGHDRFHVGIPRAKLDQNYSAATAPLDKIEATLKGLRSHDRAYMVEPFGVTYDVYAPPQTTSTSSLIQSVEHHNLMIARNILQSFSAQGEQRHGSFGAAKVTSDVYFDALEGEANEIGSELTIVTKMLCDANFNMTGRKYPKAICTDISAIDFGQIAEALAKLATAKILTPDDGLEDHLRDVADLPQLPEELKGQDRSTVTVPSSPFGQPAPGAPTPAPTKLPPKDASKRDEAGKVEASKRPPFVEAGRSFGREPTAFERRVFDLHAVPSRLDAEREHLITKMADIRRAQLQAVAKRLARKDARTSTKPFTDMRHAHIAMPHVDRMERAIRETQRTVLAYGQDQVRHELERQGVKLPKTLAKKTITTPATNRQTAESSLVTSAKVTAQKQADTWQGRIMESGIRIRRGGVQGDELAKRVVNELSDEVESGAKRDAAGEVHEAFGIGRGLEASELREYIGGATYSAILDANTCDTCQELDGEEFEIDSDEYLANMPPNANCDGRDSCRCVYLYVSSSE